MSCFIILLYSGKLSRQKNFLDFEVLWLFMKVFSTKFGGMTSFGGTIGGTSKQSTNVLSSLQKFSPAKVSCYMVYCILASAFAQYTKEPLPHFLMAILLTPNLNLYNSVRTCSNYTGQDEGIVQVS